MNYTYKYITQSIANKIKLVMTDVDDTITSNDGSIGAAVKEAINLLVKQKITVGLISGRSMKNLENCADKLGINGPIIAENGGLVKLNPQSKTHTLGCQQDAVKALDKLKSRFGPDIQSGEWNTGRETDLVICCEKVPFREIQRHIAEVDIIRTSYFHGNRYTLHLVRKGISKGNILKMLLSRLDHGEINTGSTLVLGDGLNDLSMFRLFHHGVSIPNSNQPEKHRKMIMEAASYHSSASGGEGFAEVVNHIIDMRLNA